MRARILILLLFVFADAAYAEEAIVSQESLHKFSGNIEFGGLRTTGNSETKTLDGSLDMSYGYEQWLAEFYFKGTQTSESGLKTSEYFESQLKGEYEFPMQVYGLALLGFRQDVFGGLYSEKTGLAGVGYHVFEDTLNYAIDLELGYGVRYSEKVGKKTVDRDPGRHYAILTQYAWSDDDVVKLNFTMEAGNDDDFKKKELSWVHTLYEALHVDFSYELRQSTSPELGKRPIDTNLSVKLGYGF